MSIDATTAENARRPGLFILIAMSAIGPIALNIFIPSMPGLQAAFNTDYATVQLTLTCYLAALAVAQLVLGPISDRFGRRPVFLAGMVIYIAASIACVFASTIEQLIIGRILQAFGGCAGIVLARAIIRDLYERDRAASLIGYVTMAMVVAPMLAPAIGGVLDAWGGWRSGFYLVTVLGALLLCWPGTSSMKPITRGRIRRFMRLARNCGALLRAPAFMGYALNSAFGSCIFFAFLAAAPFLMTDVMGRTPAEYGVYFIIVSIGYMFGNFLSGRFAQRAGVDPHDRHRQRRRIGRPWAFGRLHVLDSRSPLPYSGPWRLFAIRPTA